MQARVRAEKDAFRLPTRYYEPCEGLGRSNGGWRLLKVGERCLLRGFEAKHLLGLFAKKEAALRKGDAGRDLAEGYLAAAPVCPVLAWLLGRWLFRVGVLSEAPSGDDAWGVACREEERRVLGELLRDELSAADACRELTAHMVRIASYRGSDVRLATGTLLSPNVWPRRPVPSDWWRWRVVGSFPLAGEFINILELTAALAAFKWRMRRVSEIRGRFGHLLDSQVCIGVLCKGRSSSQILRRVLRKCAALLMAASAQGVYLYVRSEDNPADRPSRW